MPGKKDHGLYGVVFGTAIVLALILVYFGARRIFRSSGGTRPTVAAKRLPAAERKTAGRAKAAPTRIPPMKLLRIEGKRKSPTKSVPPAVPMPPITPDQETQ